MSAYKSVLVVGASGRAGSAITAELLSKKGQFEKLGVLTSKPAASATPDAKAEYWASLAKQGVEVIRVDLSDVKAVTNVLKGWEAVVSAVGMPLVKMQLELIDAAIEAGVKRFLPSEFGFDLTLPQNRAEKVYGMKVAIADKLKEAAERNPGFTYTLVSNGAFAEFTFAVPFAFGVDVENYKADLVGDGEEPISFTSFLDVAAFVVAILIHPTETANATIRVEGAVANWKQVIAILEKVSGKKYTVTFTPLEEAQKKETELWASGNAPVAARLGLRRVMARGDAKLPYVQNDLFPEVTPTTDLTKIATAVLKEKGIPTV